MSSRQRRVEAAAGTARDRPAIGPAWLGATVIAGAVGSLAVLWPFTVEDAFITYRYAANLVDLGVLRFNPSEAVNALTSPLHAVLSALLYAIARDPVGANRTLGLASLAVVAALVWRSAPDRSAAPLTTAMAVLPAPVLLWSIGGLETPLVMLCATAAAAVLRSRAGDGPVAALVVAALAATGFLLRHDSAPFFAPLVLFVLCRPRSRGVRVATLLVAVGPPLAWLMASWRLYGDPLPTSFYHKVPALDLGTLATNLGYQSGWLFATGLVPVALVLWSLRRPTPPGAPAVGSATAWIVAGLGLQLLYGLTTATHHMMFAFRGFMPYLPAAAMMVGRLSPPRRDRRWRLTVAALVAALAALQLVQSAALATRSLNGFVPLGEYRRVGVLDYRLFLDTLEEQAAVVGEHWRSLPDRPDRPPRILTFAAGVLPYHSREAYIYERLVSYRHHEPEDAPCLGVIPSADYLHLMAPRHGPLERQTASVPVPLQEISARRVPFDGSIQTLYLLHNPWPEPHRLGTRVDRPCLEPPGDGSEGVQ